MFKNDFLFYRQSDFYDKEPLKKFWTSRYSIKKTLFQFFIEYFLKRFFFRNSKKEQKTKKFWTLAIIFDTQSDRKVNKKEEQTLRSHLWNYYMIIFYHKVTVLIWVAVSIFIIRKLLQINGFLQVYCFCWTTCYSCSLFNLYEWKDFIPKSDSWSRRVWMWFYRPFPKMAAIKWLFLYEIWQARPQMSILGGKDRQKVRN